jgi:hypothetical protein
VGERRVVETGVYCRRDGMVVHTSRVVRVVRVIQCCAAALRNLGCWVAGRRLHVREASRMVKRAAVGVVYPAVVTRLR